MYKTTANTVTDSQNIVEPLYAAARRSQTNLLERATGLEPALRDGLPTGLENQRATLTPRPRLGTIVAHFGALFC